ncbi:HAMP domain-containing sensor histidine kinase [Loktanella salsilacus]|uniref:sensor histidine kinase n=1 Tax=Loktanella salsilacus TaxID=195913 RepID=UPI0030F5053D
MATEEHRCRVTYRSLLLRAVILLSLLGAVAFGVGVVSKLSNEVQTIQTAEQSDPIWIASQLQFELLRFENTLGRVALGRDAISDVMPRFDVAWSRINVLKEGKLLRLMSEYDVDQAVLKDLELAFATIEPAVNKVVASETPQAVRLQKIEQIQIDLDGFDMRLRDFLMTLVQSNNEAMADFRTGLLYLSSLIAYLGAIMVSVFAIIIALVLLELRSSRKISNAMRLLAQEATSASQMKMNFMSVVSHELRTPMTSILGGLALLKVRIDKTTQDAATLKLLEVARRNGDRLLMLVNDIIDAQALTEGKVTIDRKAVDLNDVVNTAVENCSAYADKLGVSYRVTISSDKMVAYTDSSRVSQVLVNLLSNAAKFTAEGDVVQINATQFKGMARVEVTDHGIGISDEEQKNIFSPFHQTNPGSTAGNKSSGLGLSITKQLMDLLGGRMGVHSIEGKGTTFWIELELVSGS